ncbi:MAG: hypothetical protein ACSHYA_18220 [Opitutaceae bacterium]
MKKNRNIQFTIALALVLMSSIFSGCATPARSVEMIPEVASYGNHFSETIAVSVTGGQETNPMWTSEVSNDAFEAALEASIEKTGLFSAVLDSEIGDLRLDVRLIELKQPIIGLNFTVTARSEWRLRSSMKEAPFWRETITTDYTAEFGDAVVAITRLKLANEGAIRENIRAGLSNLSELDLK